MFHYKYRENTLAGAVLVSLITIWMSLRRFLLPAYIFHGIIVFCLFYAIHDLVEDGPGRLAIVNIQGLFEANAEVYAALFHHEALFVESTAETIDHHRHYHWLRFFNDMGRSPAA